MPESSQERTDRISVETQRESVSLKYLLLMNISTLVVFAVLGLLYINYVDKKRADDVRKADQQWCELVVLYDDYFQSSAGRATVERDTSGLAAKQAELMHRRRVTLGC